MYTNFCIETYVNLWLYAEHMVSLGYRTPWKPILDYMDLRIYGEIQ